MGQINVCMRFWDTERRISHYIRSCGVEELLFRNINNLSQQREHTGEKDRVYLVQRSTAAIKYVPHTRTGSLFKTLTTLLFTGGYCN